MSTNCTSMSSTSQCDGMQDPVSYRSCLLARFRRISKSLFYFIYRYVAVVTCYVGYSGYRVESFLHACNVHQNNIWLKLIKFTYFVNPRQFKRVIGNTLQIFTYSGVNLKTEWHSMRQGWKWSEAQSRRKIRLGERAEKQIPGYKANIEHTEQNKNRWVWRALRNVKINGENGFHSKTLLDTPDVENKCFGHFIFRKSLSRKRRQIRCRK